MKSKNWSIAFIIVFISGSLLLGAITVIFDPYFHYHKPLKGMSYTLRYERYINDGIAKHFDYDAVITGSSMTENFKTSEMDRLFDVSSVKIPFSGGTFKEMNDIQTTALVYHPDIKIMIRSLDLYNINREKNAMREDLGEYPYYLYDDNIWNDVRYVFNKDVLIDDAMNNLIKTINHVPSTSFDEYASWMSKYSFGKEVFASYTRKEKADSITSMSTAEKLSIAENMDQNVTQLVDQYPETQFYYFFPPYSIYYWYEENQSGCLKKAIDEQMYATELMLQHPNIHVFGFLDEHEMICDVENYMDSTHYGENINSRILSWMKENKHELTEYNYKEYYRNVSEFLNSYDYDSLFPE